LVYKQSDLDKAEKNDTGKGEEDDGKDGDSGGSEQTGDENSASTVSRRGVVSVFGLAIGIIAGTGMLLAW
jgi:hypothetical protein